MVAASSQQELLVPLVLVCAGRNDQMAATMGSIERAVSHFAEQHPDVVPSVTISVVAEDVEYADLVASCFDGAQVSVEVSEPGEIHLALDRARSATAPWAPITLFPGDLLTDEELDHHLRARPRLDRVGHRGELPQRLARLRMELPTDATAHPETVFEGLSVVWAGFTNTVPAHFGAFSFSWSPITPAVSRVGRYCSVATEVIFGPGQHPMTGISTSSFMYLHHGPFVDHWREVGKPELLPFGEEGQGPGRTIEVGNDVWIGARACIMEGVTLGDGCIVGTNAIVTKDVPPYAIVAGSPARVIRYRFDEALVERMQEVAWWQYDFTDIAHLDLTRPAVALELIAERRASGELHPYVGNQRPVREVLPELSSPHLRG